MLILPSGPLPGTAAVAAVGAASLAGLPLITAGFYSKDAILWAMLQQPLARPGLMLLLIVTAGMRGSSNSVVSSSSSMRWLAASTMKAQPVEDRVAIRTPTLGSARVTRNTQFRDLGRPSGSSRQRNFGAIQTIT